MSFSSFWVTPHLGFASEPMGAADARRIATMGITDVLDLRAEAADQGALYRAVGVNYLRDPMIDDGRNQPVSVYTTGVAFARAALARGGTVMIHCAAGQYRSPSMVYAVLRSMGYQPDTAWSMILRARASANRQYVASAERAVPYLPAAIAAAGAGALSAPADEGIHPLMFAAGLFVVGGGVWLAGKWYFERPRGGRARAR